MKTLLIVIIGSPGSGKSYYINNELKPQGYHLFDDYFANAINDIGDMQHSISRDKLIASLKNYENCVIADIDFSKEEKQEEIRKFMKDNFADSVEIQWHCFENDPALCIRNVLNRNIEKSTKQIKLIEERTPGYTIPAGAKIMKTYDTSSTGERNG